jgi:hypothetical protein
MNLFNVIFLGLYITLFATPVVAFVFRKRIEKYRLKLFYISCVIVVLSVGAIRFGVSFVGVSMDVLALYLLYFMIGLCIVQLSADNNKILKILGALCLVPIILMPLLSVPAVLGIMLTVGDLEPIYSTYDEQGHLCRVTSYGNATTSTGGFEVGIYNNVGFIEYQIDFAMVDNTRMPEITPERVCNLALSELQS